MGFRFLSDDWIEQTGLKNIEERKWEVVPGRFGSGLYLGAVPLEYDNDNMSGLDLDIVTAIIFNVGFQGLKGRGYDEPFIWGTGRLHPGYGAIAFWVKGSSSPENPTARTILFEQTTTTWGRLERQLIEVELLRDGTITAYVEDSQTVQKEVDFTCYISDGSKSYSSLNFNKMITKTPASISKNFAIPLGFNPGQQYVLQCYADYYNLGSRRDSFYDTFTTNPGEGGSFGGNRRAGGAPITGGIIDEEGGGENGGGLGPISPQIKKILWILFLVLMIIILFKALNIRGEIRFGQEHFTKRFYGDKKVSKLQKKLNRKILKNDLKKGKLKKSYPIRKISKKDYHKLGKNKGR